LPKSPLEYYKHTLTTAMINCIHSFYVGKQHERDRVTVSKKPTSSLEKVTLRDSSLFDRQVKKLGLYIAL